MRLGLKFLKFMLNKKICENSRADRIDIVFLHRDAVLQKPKRLQETIASGVRHRQSSLVDKRADFHIISRQKII